MIGGGEMEGELSLPFTASSPIHQARGVRADVSGADRQELFTTVLDGGFWQSHQYLVMTLLPGEFSPHYYIHIGC